jgi:hypothetical protein
MTPEQRDRYVARKAVAEARRGHDAAAETAALKGKPPLAAGDEADIRQRLKYPDDLTFEVSKMSADDAAKVYQAMNAEEKGKAEALMQAKIARSKTLSDDQQDALFTKLGISPPKDLGLDREYERLQKLARADHERLQELQSLGRQIAAAEDAGDPKKSAELLARQQSVAHEPLQLTGDEFALHKRLEVYRTQRARLEKQVEEGSLSAEQMEQRLKPLRPAVRVREPATAGG